MFEETLCTLSHYGLKEGDKVRFTNCGFVYTADRARWVYNNRGNHLYRNEWGTVVNAADCGNITVKYRRGERVIIQNKGEDTFRDFVVRPTIIQLIPYEV